MHKKALYVICSLGFNEYIHVALDAIQCFKYFLLRVFIFGAMIAYVVLMKSKV